MKLFFRNKAALHKLFKQQERLARKRIAIDIFCQFYIQMSIGCLSVTGHQGIGKLFAPGHKINHALGLPAFVSVFLINGAKVPGSYLLK
jgi:hypothetical protein